MVFNLSYGIQGQARYTHVPSILEMVGIPYVGSGPLAHSLALDKVVSKIIFGQHGLPTPQFAVLDSADFELPDLAYPLIVKPKHEAVSFGIRIVNNEEELREAALIVFEQFNQSALVERYIEGREVNVGLLGNTLPEAFPPVEIDFGADGPGIYTLEDKKGRSGREISYICPASISKELRERAQDIARRAFKAIGCFDCARVDMRLDKEGNIYLLEINSLPSLAHTGSFVIGAEHVGLDFTALINRLVEVASARYFGTPHPPQLTAERRSPDRTIFSFLTQRRDRLEKRVQRWTQVSSSTDDPVGIRIAMEEATKVFRDLGMSPVPSHSDDRLVWTWETEAKLDGGTLLIAHIDVPLAHREGLQVFRREPEWLYGEGIGSSRGSLTMIEFALRALHHGRLLQRKRIGVLLYADEGLDCRYSSALIRKATAQAARVLVLRPGGVGDSIIIERRGQRTYRLIVEGTPRRVDKNVRKPDPLRWASAQLEAFSNLSSPEGRLSIAATDLSTTSFPMYLPHRVTATILLTYAKARPADDAEAAMRERLASKQFTWKLELISDRPPLVRRRLNTQLAGELAEIAQRWEIPFTQQSSAWPSVAGLVPPSVPVVCGVAPLARELYTPRAAISRMSLVQRTLLLAQFLAEKE